MVRSELLQKLCNIHPNIIRRDMENIRRQSYFRQIQREKSDAVSLMDVESNKGVKIDE